MFVWSSLSLWSLIRGGDDVMRGISENVLFFNSFSFKRQSCFIHGLQSIYMTSLTKLYIKHTQKQQTWPFLPGGSRTAKTSLQPTSGWQYLDVTPCSSVNLYLRFARTCCFRVEDSCCISDKNFKFSRSITITIFQDVTLCRLAERYQRFGETCWLHLHGRRACISVRLLRFIGRYKYQDLLGYDTV
jgi:hypothetical protein